MKKLAGRAVKRKAKKASPQHDTLGEKAVKKVKRATKGLDGGRSGH